MKKFIAAHAAIIAAASGLVGATVVVADELPNPSVGECAIADISVTRTEPTMIDPDGEVTGLRIWQVCGFQVPNDTGGVRAVDDTFVTDVDIDQAEVIVSAAGELAD